MQIPVKAEPDSLLLDIDETAVIVVDMQNEFGSRGGLFDRIGIDISPSRCAIAHVGHNPFVNPDASEDSRRLARDAHIVRDLAKLAIEQMP